MQLQGGSIYIVKVGPFLIGGGIAHLRNESSKIKTDFPIFTQGIPNLLQSRRVSVEIPSLFAISSARFSFIAVLLHGFPIA